MADFAEPLLESRSKWPSPASIKLTINLSFNLPTNLQPNNSLINNNKARTGFSAGGEQCGSHLKGNLPELAQKMGNSPREIINSYKRNVTDAEADEWFNIMPPKDYAELIYQHIQNVSRQFGVSSKEDAIPSFT